MVKVKKAGWEQEFEAVYAEMMESIQEARGQGRTKATFLLARHHMLFNSWISDKLSAQGCVVEDIAEKDGRTRIKIRF